MLVNAPGPGGHDRIVTMLADTAARFLDVVAGLEADDWTRPALGDWNVKELVAHTLRAFTTIDNFLDRPCSDVEIGSAAAYYATVLAVPEVHTWVAERGREAAARLSDDPRDDVAAQVAATLDRLSRTSGDEIGTTAGGAMRLDDYLGTRLVELVVHHADLCAALGEPTEGLGDVQLEVLTTVLASASDDDRTRVLRAVLGRESLPPGFSVWP